MLFPWSYAVGGISHNLDDEQQVPRHEHADAEHGSASVLGNDRLGDLPARLQLQSYSRRPGVVVGQSEYVGSAKRLPAVATGSAQSNTSKTCASSAAGGGRYRSARTNS
jgi:hypothetical protein